MRDTAASVNKPLHQCIPVLDEKHPLAAWWSTYWVPHLQIALHPIENFLEAVSKALSQVSPDTPNLQTHLSQKLDASYHQAAQAVHSSFTQVVDNLQKLPQSSQPEQALATLLRLSLLQMRYQDYLEGRVDSAIA